MEEILSQPGSEKKEIPFNFNSPSIIEQLLDIFRQNLFPGDFEEEAGLAILSHKLAGLSKDQFASCIAFIQREYKKLKSDKIESPGLGFDERYLRDFVNRILMNFEGEKLSLVLTYINKFGGFEFRRYSYEHMDIKNNLIDFLKEQNDNITGKLIELDEEKFNIFHNFLRRKEVIEFVVNHPEIITNENISCLKNINDNVSRYNNDSEHTRALIDLCGLLFLNQKISNLERIFSSVNPQFIITAYSFVDEGPERVTSDYYRRQLLKMQDDFLQGELDRENFLVRLKSDYLQERVFRGPDEIWVPG